MNVTIPLHDGPASAEANAALMGLPADTVIRIDYPPAGARDLHFPSMEPASRFAAVVRHPPPRDDDFSVGSLVAPDLSPSDPHVSGKGLGDTPLAAVLAAIEDFNRQRAESEEGR